MKSIRRMALFGALVAMGAGAPSGTSTAQGALFTLRICNSSSVTAGVAIAARLDPRNRTLAGWGIVEPGDCIEAGTALKGWIYHYAEEVTQRGRKAVWAGNEIRLCVEYPGPFRRQLSDGYECNQRELKGFGASFVAENIGTYTLNLN